MRHVDPIYPVTPDTSKDEYYFTIESDYQGRIVSVKFPKVGGQGMDPHYGPIIFKIMRKKDREIWRFFDSSGSPIRLLGVYAEGYRLDKNGYPESITCLDSLGNPMTDSLGVTKYLVTCNELGMETDYLRLNAAGDTISNISHSYRTHYVYDEKNRLIERANYDSSGSLGPESEGYAISRIKYDSLNNIIERSFYDSANYPCGTTDSPAARIVYSYNEMGDLVEMRKFDRFGTLIDDYPIIQLTYWENGRLKEYKMFDKFNVIRFLYKMTSQDIPSESRYFGPDGKPEVDKKAGYAALISSFDDNGNEIEYTFYDEKMRPFISPVSGFATEKSEYDDKNFITKRSYFNQAGELFEIPKFNYAFVTYTYDYAKQVITETYRDIRGFPKKCSYGYAIKTNYCDKNWNLIKSRFFDENGVEITSANFSEDSDMVQ
jgi:hypothetical protein